VNTITSTGPCYSTELPLKLRPLQSHGLDYWTDIFYTMYALQLMRPTVGLLYGTSPCVDVPREQPQEVGNKTDCEVWVIFWIASAGILFAAKIDMNNMFVYLKYITDQPT